MITLFIDTSNNDVSIAIIRGNEILAKKKEYLLYEHSIYTISYLDEVLKKAGLEPTDIDQIMVVNGPGSFTGVRIGLTIAKTYAFILKKDLILLSSLKVMALSEKGEYILAITYAKHDNYYFGLYDRNYQEVIKEQFNSGEELIKVIKQYPDLVIVSNSKIDIPKVNIINDFDLIKIVNYYKDKKEISIHQAKPNYLKLPQAME